MKNRSKMKFFKAGKCVSKARLDGKTAIVTGSNTGIGKITAREFYRIGKCNFISYLYLILNTKCR